MDGVEIRRINDLRRMQKVEWRWKNYLNLFSLKMLMEMNSLQNIYLYFYMNHIFIKYYFMLNMESFSIEIIVFFSYLKIITKLYFDENF